MPRIFHLYRFGARHAAAEATFRELILSKCVIDAYEFDGIVAPGDDTPEDEWDYVDTRTLIHENVENLDRKLLAWNKGGSMDYEGNNASLAWLAVGSLVMLEPLRDPAYCRSILRCRSRLYLLAGFEQNFFYLGTVSTNGLIFEQISGDQ